MAEDLVTTSSNIRERRILIVFYLTILAITAIIIAVIVWVVDRQSSLISVDVETHEAILESISESNEKLNIIDDNIASLNEKLSKEIDLGENKQILADLSALYTQAILINYEINSEYELILLLDLPNEYIVDAEDQIIRVSSATEKYQQTLDRIDRELFTLEFNNSYLSALQCYELIDLSETSTLISSEVNKCHKFLDDSNTLLLQYESRLSETVKYLELIRSYWDTSVLLYQAIESQDEATANTLREEVDAISIRRTEQEPISSEELREFTNEGF